MTHYLVVARGICDDVPLALFASRQDAVAFTRGVTRDQIKVIADRIEWPMRTEVDIVHIVSIEDGRLVRTYRALAPNLNPDPIDA